MMEPDSESEEDQQDMQPQGSNVVVPVSASLTASGSDGAAPAAVPAPAQPIAGPQLTFTPHGNGIYNKDDTAAVTRSRQCVAWSATFQVVCCLGEAGLRD